MAAQTEETAAIERCIRSFIIKSIHAIVQARSGNAYSTGCISDVGARNNLMVYLEEDPEIGATIKQNLDSGFPIKIGDAFSLEILMSCGLGGGLVVLEVWQFRLDTEENLLRCGGLPCSKIVANHSGLQPAISSIRPLAKTKSPVETACFAVEDFRRSRLFERLGTLLKTLIVTTRLLPAYSYSRRQPLDAVVDPGQVGEPQPDVQMCYALRRGELTLDRLGGEEGVICRQVGHLFPGLGTANHSSPSAKNPHNFVPIFLNVSVRYRGSLDDMGLLQECLDVSHPRNTIDETENKERRRRKRLVRPAFATNIEDFAEKYLSEEDEDEDNNERVGGEHLEYFDGDEEDMSQTYVNNNTTDYIEDAYPECPVVDEQEDTDGDPLQLLNTESRFDLESRAIPLQLPFSTVGIGSRGGARLAHLVVELRKKTDLELFRVPGTSAPTNTTTSSSVTQNASLFDALAFGDELEGHEKRLQEFDDFLADFSALPTPPVPLDVHQKTTKASN